MQQASLPEFQVSINNSDCYEIPCSIRILTGKGDNSIII